MTENVSGSITSMAWKPKLIKLTGLGLPGLNNQEQTPVYIEPSLIEVIMRSIAKYDAFPDYSQECTAIRYPGGWLHVIELPEQVARLRDESMGFSGDNPLKAVT